MWNSGNGQQTHFWTCSKNLPLCQEIDVSGWALNVTVGTFSFQALLDFFLSFFFFLFLHTHIFTVTHWVFDRPGNWAVEMFSRRTMQIRRSPQGGAVNGFNHQQDLQRGCVFVCVRVCARVHVSVCAPTQGHQTQTCFQLVANKLDNYWGGRGGTLDG